MVSHASQVDLDLILLLALVKGMVDDASHSGISDSLILPSRCHAVIMCRPSELQYDSMLGRVAGCDVRQE